MKFSKIMVLICCLVVSEAAFGNWFCYSKVIPEVCGNSSPAFIIMEDDIFLRVDSGNPNDPVAEVEIYFQGQSIWTNNLCSSQACLSNLSNLANGEYLVVVTTNNNSVFSDLITLDRED